jgi:hypothetical protein
MNTQSSLTLASSPWVENYTSGYINMKTEKKSTYKPKVLKYDYAINTAKQIMGAGDNSSIKSLELNGKEVTLKKTVPLEYEEFINLEENINIPKEKFILPLNMSSHTNPIWVLITFLIALWIIFFISQSQ